MSLKFTLSTIVGLLLASLALLFMKGVYGTKLPFLAESPNDIEVVSLNPISEDQTLNASYLLFHGCAGDYDPNHQNDWANFFSENNKRSYLINSYRKRDISNEFAHQNICSGKWMWGQRRSQDVENSLSLVSEDNLTLVGWSHGAWSVLEYLNRQPDKRVHSAVLFYPYCGGVASEYKNIPQHVDLLLILATNDDVIDNDECLKNFKGRANVTVKYFSGIHGFDLADSVERYNFESTKAVQSYLQGWMISN